MNEQKRLSTLAHIDAALAEADKAHTPEELADAAHALQRELDDARTPAQATLLLRPIA